MEEKIMKKVQWLFEIYDVFIVAQNDAKQLIGVFSDDKDCIRYHRFFLCPMSALFGYMTPCVRRHAVTLRVLIG